MTDDAQVTENSTSDTNEKKIKKYIERAAKLTGYSTSDINVFNLDTLVFTTDNGGKYRINKAGTEVQRLSGPVQPNMVGVV